MPLRNYRCAEEHVTEELFPQGVHPKYIACLVCGGPADSIVTAASFKLFGGTSVYDPKDVWEGTPLSGAGEPSLEAQENWVSKKEQVDLGVTLQHGAKQKQVPGRQWDQAQDVVMQAARENVG